MKNLFVRFVREEEGQDLVEYALLLALIALVSIGAVRTLGQTVLGVFTNINTSLGTP
jgi:pilus assembly protein Flp/PilA